MKPESKRKIDDDALSRQLATFGHEAQHKLMAMKVYISGINGLGIQVAKNLILAGPGEVGIYDNGLVEVRDLSRNFYAREDHIGKVTRANASIEELQQLNPNADVFIAQSQEIDYITEKFTFVVVIDNYDKDYLIKLNDACRKKGIGFIAAGNLGLYGYTFVDFGEEHSVFDSTGEAEVINHIAGVTQEEEGQVFLHDEKKHDLSDGDVVTFKEVKGMVQLNGKYFKVKVKNQKCYTIGDTRNYTPYESGGIATQVKVPEKLSFKSFEQSLKNPYAPKSTQLPICSWEKFGYPEQLHVILNGMYDFWAKQKRIPALDSQEDIKTLKDLIQSWLKDKIEEQNGLNLEKVDQKLIQSVARYAETQISPTCSFWGGIIAQQIFKFTGKYTPLRQWLHHEYFEVLPEQKTQCSYLHTRYFDYNALFGDFFTEKAAKMNSFLIGAGALGCQFIKMFALMGLSTHSNTKTVCTDDDSIQISNLNRQFLFRKQHVGKNKSETACSAGRVINESFNIQSVKLKVAPNTEDYFNDGFWENLDFVVNAVDNIAARKYLDLQCVWYEKPLFESGTLGTKCHSQIILPHKTLTYNDIQDPPETGFALCTVKNAPYMIEHTIQWAREYFQEAIAEPTQDLQKFYLNKKESMTHIIQQNVKNPSISRNRLIKLKDFYHANKQRSFEKCVEMAVNIFYECFYFKISDLLSAFPADAIDKETGKPFWSPPKRPPTAIALDLNDSLHVELIQAGANILATSFKIEKEKDSEVIKKIASNIQPARRGKAGKITFNEDKNKEPITQFSQDDAVEVKSLFDELLNQNTEQNLTPQAIAFEKDDPTNWHIQFMAGLSNLRARNYEIEEADKFKIKIIAGKIIPAIATTTAMVVGAVGIEIIKLILEKDISAFKNVTINLALPLWVFNDPQSPIVITHKEYDQIMLGPVRAYPEKFTTWDKTNIQGPKTVQQIKEFLQKQHDIEISLITYGNATVYSNFLPGSAGRLSMKLEEAIESAAKINISKEKKYLRVAVSGNTKNDGIDCLLPDIRYRL